MKVQVKDEQGIDEAGNKHPAPGIGDGTHECELKLRERKSIEHEWKFCVIDGYDPICRTGYQHELIWVLAEQVDDGTTIICGDTCGCKDKSKCELAEQEKEVKTAEEVFNDYINIRTVGNDVAQNIIDAMVTYAAQFKDSTSSTRIAELQARVAELEGVLKEINRLSVLNKNPPTFYPKLISIGLLATNALKNQQP